MPGTSIGNATRYSTATAWAASQVRALGALCTPSTPNGLVFICTTSGTTAASEPAWNTPPYPTIGTVFTDGGGVGWTAYGTQPGNFPTIAQLPVDSDPPLAFAQVIQAQTVLDELAWLVARFGTVGYLAGNNVWTGGNIFANVSVDGTLDVGGTTTVQGIIVGGTATLDGNVVFTEIGGEPTTGTFGANATVAGGTIVPSITTAQQLATYTPAQNGFVRVDVGCGSPDGGSSTPLVSLSFYDSLTSSSISMSNIVPMTLMNPGAPVASVYYWTGSYVLAVGAGTAVIVDIKQHSSETLTGAWATITAIA